METNQEKRIKLHKETVFPMKNTKNFYSSINFLDRSSKNFTISNFCSKSLKLKLGDEPLRTVETDLSKPKHILVNI